eukprot:4868547-Pyramimonas_sp.AAC.1
MAASRWRWSAKSGPATRAQSWPRSPWKAAVGWGRQGWRSCGRSTGSCRRAKRPWRCAGRAIASPRLCSGRRT